MGLVARLSGTTALLLLVSFVAMLWVAVEFFDRYMLETSQRLSRDIAAHIVDDLELLRDGAVNDEHLKQLAHDAMVINPNIEVYVLDSLGAILGHALPAESVRATRVDMAPVRRFLSGDHVYPLLGVDPRSDARKIFSAAPIHAVADGAAADSAAADGAAADRVVADGANVDPSGYVYVVLRGRLFGSMAERLRGSYVWPVALTALGALAATVALLAFLLTRNTVRPLRRLTAELDDIDLDTARDFEGLREQRPERLREVRTLRSALSTMAARLGDQYAELDRADQLRRELISNVSHDLRTPLTTVQGYLETLLLRGDQLTPEERTDQLRRAFKGSERLGDLVGSLFELAKLDAGLDRTNMEECSVAEVAQDVVQELSIAAKQKDIGLALDVSDPCYVLADIGLLQRVFENLIGNAIRYTPKGGSVRVAVRKLDAAINVSVSDTGVGIPVGDSVDIFSRFSTGNVADSDETAATGLGLAIVKRILELHHSAIHVKSEPSVGSEFWFDLPMLQPG